MTARRDRTWLGIALVVLAVYVVLRATVLPDRAHGAANTAMIGVVGAVAAAAGLTRRELGLERSRVGAGLRLGGLFVAAVTLVVVVAGVLSDDPLGMGADQAAQSLGSMLFAVLVRIPVTTVLLEELAFRGVVAALAERVAPPRRALIGTATVFGLWHLPSLWPAGGVADRNALARMLVVLVATSVAGVALHAMKRRSDSLAAPLLAHWGTNGVAFAVIWLILQ